MKKAIIYFEGKEVEQVYFDRVFLSNGELNFYLKDEEVAFFSKGYSYVSHSEEMILAEEKRITDNLKGFLSDKDERSRWFFNFFK